MGNNLKANDYLTYIFSDMVYEDFARRKGDPSKSTFYETIIC